jgi:hypothetical protein
MSMVLKVLAAGLSAVTTWNPSDKSGDINLTNGDLTATRAVATLGAYVSARGTRSRSAGKFYFESTQEGDGQVAIGLANSSFSINGAVLGTSNSIAYWGHSGDLRISNTEVLYAQILTDGDTARVAVDFTNHRIWVSKVGDDWNGSPTANPSTNTGGADFTTGMTGAALNACCFNVPGQGHTINTGRAPFLGAVPTGFRPWG